MTKRPVYKVVEVAENPYQLSHGSLFLAKFSRQNFREVIESVASAYGFSSKWKRNVKDWL